MIVRFLAAIALAVFASATAAAAATVPIETGTLSGVRDLGPAPASVRVHIAVVLNAHHDAELDRLIAMQADSGSPLYHHFLSPQQLRNYFTPTLAESARVIGALQRSGFTITNTFTNRSVVDASAPAPIAARYFNTDIHRVLSADTGLAYTNPCPGVVPADIAPALVGRVSRIGRRAPSFTHSTSSSAGRRCTAGPARGAPRWFPALRSRRRLRAADLHRVLTIYRPQPATRARAEHLGSRWTETSSTPTWLGISRISA